MRVRALQLAANDEAMLRLFINLRRRGEQQAWALQTEPGADVTLTRFAAHEAVDASTFTIWVLDAADPTPDDSHPFVRGPLHYDQLADLLDPIAEAWRSAGREGGRALLSAAAASSTDVGPGPGSGIELATTRPGFEDTLSGTGNGPITDFAATHSEPAEPTLRPSRMSSAATTSLARLRAIEQDQRRIAEQGLGSPPEASGGQALAPHTDKVRAAPMRPMPNVAAQMQAVAAESAAELTGPSRYRLTRWPPHAVLSRNPAFPRLAGFLGARHLSRQQLAQASGIDDHTCTVFIATLRSLTMLDVRSEAGSAESPAPAPSENVTSAAPAPSPATTARRHAHATVSGASAPAASAAPPPAALGAFIHRLRRRFGLG
jgi:hypothetical protein